VIGCGGIEGLGKFLALTRVTIEETAIFAVEVEGMWPFLN
jgi:hypothetical protein